MIEIEGLRHGYDGSGDVLALDAARVAAGGRWLLLGKSGSGKSTLLHILGGLLRPRAGRVVIDGQAVTDVPEGALDRWRGRTVGIVFQRLHLFETLSAADNLRAARLFAGLPPDEARVAEILSRLDLTDRAEHVEHVAIAMRSGLPDRGSLTVGFGAAARYVHPATGYSVAASLGAAPRVATAIAEALHIDDVRARSLHVWSAVWPSEHRRARALHDYGLGALLRLPAGDVQTFFEAFFELPTEQWGDYLRVDTSAAAVSRVMRSVFSSVPWRVRRRLATGSPLPFAQLLR